jgi:ParB family transcriptional regulator, chromosome partitioning protein
LFDLNTLSNHYINPLERAIAINEALTGDALSKKDLAKKINKSSSYISNHLRLLQLPDLIKEALLSQQINEGQARAISFLDDQQDMLKIYEDTLKFNYSVRDVEREVNKLRKNKKDYGKVSSELKSSAQKIAEKLQVEVKITRRERKIIFSLVLPLGIIAYQKIKKVNEALSLLQNDSEKVVRSDY